MSNLDYSELRQRVSEARCFSPEFVSRCQEIFHFDESSSLANELEDAAFWFVVSLDHQSGRSRGKALELLEQVSKRAASLRDVLTQLGKQEMSLLGHYANDWSRHDLIEQMRVTERLADHARAELNRKPVRRGKPKDHAKRALIHSLYAIYRQGTDHTDLFTRDPETHRYSGLFIRFASQVFGELGVPIKNSFLGDTLAEMRESETS